MDNRTDAPVAARSVAFIGLGVMGYPMAGHLVRAGHRVTVYNRNPAKAAQWVAEYGAGARASPRLAAEAPTSSVPASATTTTCARWCSATRGLRRDARRRDLRRPHDGIGGSRP
jgi:glutamyl-tRNA reductase